MFRELRPVGERVTTESDAVDPIEMLEGIFAAPVLLFDSGTAALSAALMAAEKRASAAAPEVLMPAYCCPDLLSAANYAGLKPVLIDCEYSKPWMSLAKLEQRITHNTVAIIAVNFLGIPERIAAIKKLTQGRDITVIEDSAQYFPVSGAQSDRGDMTVLSFGKGKPVSLLHGGALVLSEGKTGMGQITTLGSAYDSMLGKIKYLAKTRLYNQIINPGIYGLLAYIPFLGVGETRYKPLQRISEMGSVVTSLLSANISLYRMRDEAAQAKLHEMLLPLGKNIIRLADLCQEGSLPRLLRYPVLLDSAETKEYCYRRLRAAGLGVSRMYPAVLPGIQGVHIDADIKNYPAAADFSARLLTLPVHSDVTEQDMHAMVSVLDTALKRNSLTALPASNDG